MQVLFLLLAFCFVQRTVAQKKTFMRVIQIGTPKTIRGFYAGITDSAIIIFSHQQSDTILYSGIQQIKTRRSGGHNILLGAVGGIVAGTITGLATYKKPEPRPPVDPNCILCPIFDYEFSLTQGEAATIGGITGGLAGVAAGGIISLSGKKNKFIVVGNSENWLVLRKTLESLPAFSIK